MSPVDLRTTPTPAGGERPAARPARGQGSTPFDAVLRAVQRRGHAATAVDRRPDARRADAGDPPADRAATGTERTAGDRDRATVRHTPERERNSGPHNQVEPTTADAEAQRAVLAGQQGASAVDTGVTPDATEATGATVDAAVGIGVGAPQGTAGSVDGAGVVAVDTAAARSPDEAPVGDHLDAADSASTPVPGPAEETAVGDPVDGAADDGTSEESSVDAGTQGEAQPGGQPPITGGSDTEVPGAGAPEASVTEASLIEAPVTAARATDVQPNAASAVGDTVATASDAANALLDAAAGEARTASVGRPAPDVATDPFVGPASGASPTATGSSPVAVERAAAPASTSAQRVAAVVEQLRNAPPPRTVTVDLEALGGMRVVVSLRGDAVTVAPVSGEALDTGFDRDLSQSLAERGFSFRGDGRGGRQQGGRPDEHLRAFTARPSTRAGRPSATVSDPDGVRL